MSGQKVDRKLLLQLLGENKLTLPEIADRVGCSGERVRQLERELLGRTGRQAQRERRESEPRARRLQANFDRNGFVKAAKQQGLNVAPAKRGPLDWFKRKLYVNGKLCLLRRADKNVGYKGRYVAIRKPLQKRDICVVEVEKAAFLVIPMEEMAKSATMFCLYDPVNPLRHQWWKYLNNWSVFTEKRSGRGLSNSKPMGGCRSMIHRSSSKQTGCYFIVRLLCAALLDREPGSHDALPARCSLFSDLHLFVPRVPGRFVLLPSLLGSATFRTLPPEWTKEPYYRLEIRRGS
jgi:hypothetical protein